MFDSIRFEDISILPRSEGFDLDMTALDFQTKSLDNCLYLYTISKDKYLYREDGPFREDPTEPSRKSRMDFHGIIEFGAYHATDLVDYSLEYSAKFTDGVLQEIKLINSSTYNHDSKEARIKQIMERSKKENNRLSRKLILLIQNILICYPLKILGFNFKSNIIGVFRDDNYLLAFYCPKIILGHKNKFKKTYGISIDQLTTEACLSNTTASKELSFKILGFGFTLSICKEYMFGEE